MGKRIKKGKKGEQSQYLTRSNAIRAMQVSLKDFRRLSILKGIYPREPRKKFKGNDKTYYHIKDLKILQHDQLLEKFREMKAHLKKHKKLLGRREEKLAEKHIGTRRLFKVLGKRKAKLRPSISVGLDPRLRGPAFVVVRASQ